VVEDDPAVRHLIDVVLTCRGHDVLIAASAPLANALLLDFPAPPGVAVLDVILPKGTSGVAYGRELLSRFPGIRLVFMTGWPEAAEAIGAATLGPLLSKPVRIEDLSALVDAA
jgi:DNA-binding response OmpR family regulator